MSTEDAGHVESTCARARRAWHDYGPIALFLMLVARVLRSLGAKAWVQSYALFAQPVQQVAVRRRRFRLEALTPGAALLDHLPRPTDVIASRFGQDARCLALLRDDDLIGSAWVCFGQYVEDDVRAVFVLQPPESTAWDFDVWIAEEHRLGFAFAALWAMTNEYLDREGVRWSLSRISVFNPASIRAHERLGARRLAQVSFLTLWNVQLSVGSLWPWLHLSLRAGSAPQFTIRAPAEVSEP